MKQIKKSDIPQELLKQIGDSRFVLLSNGPFGSLVAHGADPREVLRGNKTIEQAESEGLPLAPGEGVPYITGTTLYRVDE